MQCMEVWGGNEPVDSSVVMTGLDAWVYCRPYAEGDDSPQAGGDVYFVSSCATGRITRLLIADVSGHGTVVNNVAMSLRQLMRKYVNYLDPQKFVGEMNRRFTELSENGCFATAVVTTFFAPTNQVTFCNAGHPPPLIYRTGQGWSYMECQRPGGDVLVDLPFGIEGSSEYCESDVKLGLGDLVVCYTDGLPESRGRDGELLGQGGLLEIARGIEVTDPAQVVPSLLKAIAELHPGNLTTDDITLLLFRATGAGETSPFRTRIMAPVRVIKGVLNSLRPGGGPTPWPEASLANLGGALISPLNRLWCGRRR